MCIMVMLTQGIAPRNIVTILTWSGHRRNVLISFKINEVSFNFRTKMNTNFKFILSHEYIFILPILGLSSL